MESLEQLRRELAVTPPTEFGAHRTSLTAQARAEGDRELAAAIRAIRKPTQSAWAVNLLSQQRPGEVEPFVELGRQLRVQRLDLAGDQLRELNAQRVALVRALVDSARRLARERDVTLSPTHATEVEQTLAAAFSDDEAAAAVLAGTLTTSLQYAGLGFGGAVTARRPASRSAAPRVAEPTPHRTKDEVAAAARRRAARSAAVGALDQAQQELERLAAQAQDAEHELDAAQLRVAAAERDLQHATAEEQRAEQLLDSSVAAVEAAEMAVSELQARLDELGLD